MSTVAPTRPRSLDFWTREHWLAHCEGYRVETSKGCLGFVDEVVRDPEDETPVTLVVRTSHDAFGLTEVPIALVEEIDPEAEKILVFDSPADGATR